MLPRNVLVLAVLALSACDESPDVVARPDRPEPARPMLEAGAYDMVVEDVASLACDDVSARDIVGQHLPAHLRVEGARVSLTLSGWTLAGEMEPGFLFVEGEPEVEHDEPREDEPPRDEPVDDDDGDTDVDEEPGGEGGGDRPEEEDCGEDVDCGETGEDEPGGVEPDEPDRGYASLDARILDARSADGRLTLAFGACRMELAVVMERGGEVPPVEHEDDEDSVDRPGAEEGS